MLGGLAVAESLCRVAFALDQERVLGKVTLGGFLRDGHAEGFDLKVERLLGH